MFSIIRSTEPPPGIRPTVGTFTVKDEPSPPATPSPPTIKLPCAIAYVSPSAPSSGVIKSVPPRNDLACPTVETTTSSFCPGLIKGGRSAVTMTDAAFLPFISDALVTTPN